MKFLITRTSVWEEDGDLKLSKKWQLKKEKFDYIQRFTFKTPEAYNKKNTKDWFSEGYNHKKTKDGIQRALKDHSQGWFIEINSLEELMELYNEVGDIIISQSTFNPDITEIEIYDDYRE